MQRRERGVRVTGIVLAVAVVMLALIGAALGAVVYMTRMPGSATPARDTPEAAAAVARTAAAERMRGTVEHLAGTIGVRCTRRPGSLERSASWIADRLRETGLPVTVVEYRTDGEATPWVEATAIGASQPGRVVVLGAHYDSVPSGPGANDNASGVAVLLELAREFALRGPRARTIRFVAFPNEEQPWSFGDDMGSMRYAKLLRDRQIDVAAMLSLESLGCFSDAPGSQRYPWPVGLLYPDRGNFVAFVSNLGNRALVRRCIEVFRRHAAIPSEGGALPGSLDGVGWSDHQSFWRAGYPALMVTDTALFRDVTYHRPRDLPDHLDYARMALVAEGLASVVEDLAGAE